MRWPVLLLLLPLPSIAAAQSIAPGRWDIVSTAVDLTIPGAPGFLLRMMRGRSKTEHKCLAPADASGGVAALLAPDPKAKCRVDTLRIADGRYTQTLICPQKTGDPMRIVRTGSYDANGITGRLQMTGTTPKGALAITIDQTGRHVTGACRN